MKKHILSKELLYPLMFVVFTLILPSSVLKAQFFFKEYSPVVDTHHNEGRCIINIGGSANYPNNYLTVGVYTEGVDPLSKQRHAHAVWNRWGGYLLDKRNYIRTPEAVPDLELNRIDKHLVTADTSIVFNPRTGLKDSTIYARGYPATGTEEIEAGFPITIYRRAWVTLIHRENRNLLWEDFITSDSNEHTEGRGVVVDANNPDRFFVLVKVVSSTTGETSFAVREYYYDATFDAIIQGWSVRYGGISNLFDINLAGIVQEDGTGDLVIAGTRVPAAGFGAGRIFLLKVDQANGAIIGTPSLTLGSHFITWNGNTYNSFLMGGMHANSITANDHDDGYTIGGKIVQDITYGAGGSAYRFNYTLPMIAAVDVFLIMNPVYAYRVFPTMTDYGNNDFLRGEFNCASANVHWRSGSIYCDTSYTAVGYLQDSITPLESEACMMNVNIFDPNATDSPMAAERWCSLHGTDFSQSLSTPLRTIGTWFDKDSTFIDGFTYTGRQEQPGGEVRLIGGNMQKWDGLSNCSVNPERVDSMYIDANQVNMYLVAVNWGNPEAFELSDEVNPELLPRYCYEGNIYNDFIKYIDNEIGTQTGSNANPLAKLRQTQSHIVLDIDIQYDESIEIALADIVGKVLIHERFETNKGKHTYYYETENLMSGNYFLSVKIGGKRFGYTVSIIK